MPTKLSFIDALKDIGAGTCGGIAQVVVGHPLDTIKVRLQAQSSHNPIYNGMIDCIQKTIKGEGYKALYKGAMAPLVGSCFMNMVLFYHMDKYVI